jgi:hypothetical protein
MSAKQKNSSFCESSTAIAYEGLEELKGSVAVQNIIPMHTPTAHRKAF